MREAGAVAPACILIDDPDDERVALYRNLKDRDLRQRKGLFLAESELVWERLVASHFEIRSALVHRSRLDRISAFALPDGLPIYAASAEVMEKVAGFPVHRGVLALAERGAPADWHDVAAGPGPCLVLEDVGDPDNIGALFRTAAAFGYGSVLCSPGTADPLYRKAIRSSMGWTMHVPYATLEPWPRALGDLDRTVVALTPDRNAPEVDVVGQHLRLNASKPLAVLVGAEGPGLTDAAMATADICARIPMANGVDSLNVAMACAIALYEFARPPR